MQFSMHVGFSGSRHGPNGSDQHNAVARALKELRDACVTFPQLCRFHHGDCLGFDSVAHDIAHALGWPITIHPPEKSILRAFKGKDDPTVEILKPRPYLKRNCDIVEACAIVIIAPDTPTRRAGSGTWYTYQRAKTIGRRTILILPNGTRTA